LYKPSFAGFEEGLDTAFEAPKESIILQTTAGNSFTNQTTERPIDAIGIKGGWYDLSSLRYTLDVKVTATGSSSGLQPANYDSGTAATHIALQNGSQLFNQLKNVSVRLCGQSLQNSGDYGWMWDIVTKYMSSNEEVSTTGIAEGFVPDGNTADSQTSTEYQTRAALIRPGLATNEALPVRFTGKVNLPFFTGSKQLVYLRDATDLEFLVTLRGPNDIECLEQDSSATAHRWITNMVFTIDRYYPIDALKKLYKAKLETTPQYLIYPDYKIMRKPISGLQSDTYTVTMSRGKIDALVVGFMSPTARNRRQFTPCNLKTIQVLRGSKEFPPTPVTPELATPATKMYMTAYTDYVTTVGDILNSKGSVLTPSIYAATQTLYSFDLRTANAGLFEKNTTKTTDTVTISFSFTTPTTTDMYVLMLSAGKVLYHAREADGAQEYIQGCMQ